LQISIKGIHGTCEQAAEQILAHGFKAADTRARAGSGVYFWAYNSYDTRARMLAQAWWEQKSADREYDHFRRKGFTMLHLDLKVHVREYLDLDTVANQDDLLATEAVLMSKGVVLSSEELYATYMRLAEKKAQGLGHTLKVVKTMMPPPAPYRPRVRAHLTPAVNGYIVLPGAVGLLDSSVLSVLK
jgi:hypothetical protein